MLSFTSRRGAASATGLQKYSFFNCEFNLVSIANKSDFSPDLKTQPGDRRFKFKIIMINFYGKNKNQKFKFNSVFFSLETGILFLGTISILIIGVADYIVLPDISLSICYLIPIAFITKHLDKRAGIFLSFLSAFCWDLAEDVGKARLGLVLLLWNTFVRLTAFLTIVYLLSTVIDAYKRERNLAQIDSLTKIYNRRYFLEALQNETKRAIRTQRCLTIVYFDIDNFKQVNDRLGHAQGDRLLYLVAQGVNQSIRATDIFARLGGDEFALILPETIYQTAQLILQRIHEQLNKVAQENAFEVSFSIGAVTFKKVPDSIDKMLEKVDYLMYQVKNSGKNGIKHHLSK